jgi:curved DNA-binding protein CbpA
MVRDLYETLGVVRNCTDDELKRAWRTIRTNLHPDHIADSTKFSSEKDMRQAFQEAKEAYEVLSDPKRRTLYDKYNAVSMDDYYDQEMADLDREINELKRKCDKDSEVYQEVQKDFTDIKARAKTLTASELEQFARRDAERGYRAKSISPYTGAVNGSDIIRFVWDLRPELIAPTCKIAFDHKRLYELSKIVASKADEIDPSVLKEFISELVSLEDDTQKKLSYEAMAGILRRRPELVPDLAPTIFKAILDWPMPLVASDLREILMQHAPFAIKPEELQRAREDIRPPVYAGSDPYARIEHIEAMQSSQKWRTREQNWKVGKAFARMFQ